MDGILLNMSSRYISNFLKKVNKRSDDECWEWIGAHTDVGYGVFGRPMRGAHRVSYALYYGKLPANLLVCHKCDNPKCVNPHHLFLGTHSDNMKDRNTKGRNVVRGERHGLHKLTNDEVVDIRELYANKIFSQYELADLCGVSVMTINWAVNSKSWKHV